MAPSETTNDAFLREKITRFVDYLKSILVKRLKSARYSEFAEKFEQLRTIDTAAFIVHITSEMVPYQSAIPAYVAKLLKEQNVEASELSTDELTKLCRYVECFIETVSQ